MASVTSAVGTRSRWPSRGFSSSMLKKGDRHLAAAYFLGIFACCSEPVPVFQQLAECRLVEHLVFQGELLKSLKRQGVMVPRAVGHARPGFGQALVDFQRCQRR